MNACKSTSLRPLFSRPVTNLNLVLRKQKCAQSVHWHSVAPRRGPKLHTALPRAANDSLHCLIERLSKVTSPFRKYPRALSGLGHRSCSEISLSGTCRRCNSVAQSPSQRMLCPMNLATQRPRSLQQPASQNVVVECEDPKVSPTET